MTTTLVPNEVKTLTSIAVAEMVGKAHRHLLADIRGYIDNMENLGEPNFRPTDFFIESTYTDSQNREKPCYDITRKGCEFIANKLTGQKGTVFTATYINIFHEMEQAIQTPSLTALSPQLQLLINMELKQNELEIKISDTNTKLDSIKGVVALSPTQWRSDSGRIINKIAAVCGGNEHIRPIREEAYKLLEERFGVKLGIRLTNKKRLLLENGVCKSKIDKVNKLDVIADDKKLIEGFISVIKELAIKYGIGV